MQIEVRTVRTLKNSRRHARDANMESWVVLLLKQLIQLNSAGSKMSHRTPAFLMNLMMHSLSMVSPGGAPFKENRLFGMKVKKVMHRP